MLAFMRSDAEARERRSDGPPVPHIDWNQFLALVRHHRVYPQLYARLKASQLIPADVLQALHGDFMRNTFQMLRLSGEMERVCAELQERGIRPIVLKGPVLAKELYGDLSLRTSKDLDVLVPMEDVEAAEERLLGLGYRSDGGAPRVFNWKWKVHHISFTHPETRVQVELHWRLNSDMGKEPPFEELWRRSRRSPLSKRDVHLLGGEDLFMYLVSHGARHGWFRLRWLADIDRLARLGLDWGMLAAMMRRYGCLQLGGQALTLAAAMFGTPVPPEAAPLLAGGHRRELAERSLYFIQDMVSFAPADKELDRVYKRYLYALKTRRQKSVYLISQLYPSFRDTEALPLPKPLYFLYFPLRPFVWLWRQVKQGA
ncbi:Uncharacterised nucleotidyltransferase [Paenibacillus sp. UNC496MF]|nr:Uncharacterised nucleotidyltransferase [Paenibacillus sp. UNC496MF]